MDIEYTRPAGKPRSPRPMGQIVAGYELGPVVGIGTYGEVRCARNVHTGHRVAIKIVDVSRFDNDVASLMDKEIEMLQAIDHPHCIRLIEIISKVPFTGTWCTRCACTEYKAAKGTGACINCGNHNGLEHSTQETRNVMFLVEELAAGGEMFGLLMHCGPFPEHIARHYFRQLVFGMAHLHHMGVTHRDLKPENLVFDANFNLKIIDFGLAARFSEDCPLMHTGVGSQPYSAPEVYYSKELFGGQGYQGPPADIWSAAVILFVMLTGRPPFVRPVARSHGPLRRCKHFINLLKGRGYGGVSDGAKRFLMRLFQPHPQDRPTIDEIIEDEWFNDLLPDDETLQKNMEERANSVWMAQKKLQMVEILTKIRRDLTVTPRLQPTGDPFENANTDMTLISLDDSEEPIERGVHSPLSAGYWSDGAWSCRSVGVDDDSPTLVRESPENDRSRHCGPPMDHCSDFV